MKNEKILFLLILVLFLITRLYKISEIPVSVYWDEASIGYNAYSISQTGKDEWGDFLPIHFRAFGEFKLPVYIYSAVPFIAAFGLNEFSVRLPAVLFSLGVVILTYLLARKLTDSESIGLWSSFLLTISPWFFIFSRTGYEATAGLLFYLLAIYLFFFLNKNSWFLFFSILSFILSAYSYNSFRVIIPLTILILLIKERDNLMILRKSVFVVMLSLFTLGLSLWPIYRLYVYDAGIFRLQTVGQASGVTIIKNYVAHFNPYFLFIRGDSNLRHQQPGFGQLHLPEAALLLTGLIYMFRFKQKNKWMIGLFILLGAIPASITKEAPHSLRSLSMVPFIHVISAMGAIYSMQLLRRKIIGVIIIIFLIFFANYILNFLTVYPEQSAKYWQYEYKQIFMSLKNDFEKNNRILISEENGQPYIFALFYLKIDPEKFQKEAVRNSVDQWGFSTVKRFGKFEFGQTYEK